MQAIVNPSDESLFNLRSASSNQAELRVLEVLAEADEALPLLADRLRAPGGGNGAAIAVGKAWAAAVAMPPQQQLQQQFMQQLQQQQLQQQLPPPRDPPELTLLQAVGFAGASAAAAAQGGWAQQQQQQQAAVQTLEALQQALLKAFQVTGGSSLPLPGLAPAARSIQSAAAPSVPGGGFQSAQEHAPQQPPSSPPPLTTAAAAAVVASAISSPAGQPKHPQSPTAVVLALQEHNSRISGDSLLPPCTALGAAADAVPPVAAI